ncbi:MULTISPECIES: sulfite oxidase-like oxidoreductase [Pseudomonas]|uniref:Putative molydopterin-containing oxidoreductase n=1 Tax=Pseudomonas fluorescens (strain Pf0-1) TaxID=205922 RepID=Q3KDS2_PSEPF|nr:MULTISPECIES: sulfite oxidase-like oxidoreductase [Pseudomonas]ABA74084.1 putative molydopterin-containing oxidoreductase [Pseudomonas fluorescens Pf0-1]MBL0796005.1 sulfite oxidase-like oxidoreductase [Pseudomonas sp. B7]MBY9026880.1 sulfite oxidase-like oxidoreductase [Pseudomonas fluorescens]MBY9032490.1 sulfite oxidase-like oxidoreductase [Pseudomonas fluorescens]MBY9038746.1 sulfite oxidase-like oxidoreductase [Pseudomonas fluorescens]
MHDKAARLRKSRSPTADVALGERLPPGQVLTERFPILHEGEVPAYDLATWSLRLFGILANPVELTYADLQALPQRQLQCDIHCVTRWSKFDTRWSGVHLQDLLQALDIRPTSSFVMAHADHDYQTNLRLDDLLHPDSLLATHYDGQPLTAQHGWPLRLVVAGRYFWKSAKWLRGLEFTDQEQPGFWERNGFHLHADPFIEQRFSGDTLDIAEDAWREKDFD